MIWGNNFPLKKTPTNPSRWEKLLTKAFGTNIPEFLQSSVRTFESATINDDDKYEFHFTEQKGADAGQKIKYIYESNSSVGDSEANLLVVGANDHTLTGGDGNDVLVANWTRLGEENTIASFLDGGAGDDTLYGGGGQDTLDGGSGSDHLYGNGGEDDLKGGDGEDWLYGGGESDTIQGGAGNDLLYGQDGNDTLEGNAGNDTLNGGAGTDTLKGGDGFDTYITDDGDTVTDSDGSGRVHFGGTVLTGGKKEKGKDYWKGNGGKYTLSGGGLTFKKGGKSVTIKGYNKSAASLGIQLDEEPPDDPTEPQDFSSPLVLDLNKNNITSTSLYDTNVHFDLDGDGFREKTGWIETILQTSTRFFIISSSPLSLTQI